MISKIDSLLFYSLLKYNEYVDFPNMIRIFDIFFSFLGLFFLSPILVIIFIIGWLYNRSPLFTQERVGQFQRTFILFKFRTMPINTLSVATHLAKNTKINPFGSFLRKTKLDEMPQLYNVLIGNMSLVGPRPEIPEVIDLYGENMDKYLSVKPGITCNSKASLRDYLTKEKTLKMDLDYIDNMCLSKDIQLLYKTVKSIFFNNNVNT